MIQDIDARYDNSFEPFKPEERDVLLHYRAGKVLGRLDDGRLTLARVSDFRDVPQRTTFLFHIGDNAVHLALDDGVEVPEGFGYVGLGELRESPSHDARFCAVTGSQLNRWYRENRFCSCCGHPMEPAPRSRELVCPACAHIVYPKISPGIIAGVVDGDRIVMTRYARSGNIPWRWALVSGFSEIGESIEDTVRREVMEEVGLKVRDLHFYKSQPWSYSDTLLVGFFCRLDGPDTIRVQRSELADARWFHRDEIGDERANDTLSVTGEMIELFKRKGAAVLD